MAKTSPSPTLGLTTPTHATLGQRWPLLSSPAILLACPFRVRWTGRPDSPTGVRRLASSDCALLACHVDAMSCPADVVVPQTSKENRLRLPSS
eukprot:CAMPEP_0113589596 /NCGR_PEP_ID=MMETSP0015_2-20120614/36178_1 /TAXON_ID=2838 /ORGANISM="Odontella" /LENGTH=92 /DNA_ID=CAMNT_0000495637 /DNA_START=61 /DNA_END=339 /DNA_ORIENTATION=- /assembly_acc=CAM_ASM_000160